jgi:hypothetical protein|tara:strand:+ start:1757 stop:1957 length:201 start_codon:yes stop_codon:yes gene_type:complete
MKYDLTPEEFKEAVEKTIKAQGHFPEECHICLDELMEGVLAHHGYKEGVNLIRLSKAGNLPVSKNF